MNSILIKLQRYLNMNSHMAILIKNLNSKKKLNFMNLKLKNFKLKKKILNLNSLKLIVLKLYLPFNQDVLVHFIILKMMLQKLLNKLKLSYNAKRLRMVLKDSVNLVSIVNSLFGETSFIILFNKLFYKLLFLLN